MSTQFFQTNEGTIAYDDTGSGPLVICAPGMGDLRQQYRFLAAQLVEAGYRVVTMDIRGHGESSVSWSDFSAAALGSDMLALIRHLNAGPAVLIGNSFAAGSAVWAAGEAPDLVSGLVLIGPAVHGALKWQMRLLLPVLFARPWGPSAWQKYYITLYPARKPADWAAYITTLKENIAQRGRLEALYQMMTSLTPTEVAERQMAKVSAPVFIVMGTRDPDFKDPAGEAQWVAERLKATVTLIEGAGHYPHTELPEVTGPQIAAFLKSLQPETSHAAPTR